MRATRGMTACASASYGAMARVLAVVAAITALAGPVGGQGRPDGGVPLDEGEWHTLTVPGGRATLTSLGVPAARERGAVMVELIRRLHFSDNPPTALEAAIQAVADASVVNGNRASAAAEVVLPLPLSARTWAVAVFRRDVPPRQLFGAILRDPAARLLYHGLAGLDVETRRWMASQPDLLRHLYRNDDAGRAFALFAPAVRVAGGQVVIPGGDLAVQRWVAALDVPPARAADFVRRLFDHQAGRTAGLYFTAAAVDGARRRFLLSAAAPAGRGNADFARLVDRFAACYPANATAAYPFALRSHDAALLLLEVEVSADGALAGPTGRRFWEHVFDEGDLEAKPARDPRALAGDDPIDAAWMVDRLCRAPSAERGAVFTTLLAGPRVFAGLADAERPDALAALRARRLYPAVFMALEHAGVRRSRAYAAIARHAALLARIDHASRGSMAVRQFQGALALTLDALSAATFTVAEAEALLESLAALPLDHERYDGRIAGWFEQHWLPAVRRAAAAGEPASSAEESVASALAGPPEVPARFVQWEGLDYVVDAAGVARRRLRGVRERQAGPSLDAVLALHRIAGGLQRPDVSAAEIAAARTEVQALAPRLRLPLVADELSGSGPDLALTLAKAVRDLAGRDGRRRAAVTGAALTRLVDFLLGHVLPSWAYAAHVGESDSAALTGGDSSLRHDLGLRATGRLRFTQRWALAAGEPGAIAGSLLGLRAVLAPWSLRRLSSDALPAAPSIGGNDLLSLTLTAALSESRQLTDAAMTRIATALAGGAAAIERLRQNPVWLADAAATVAMSPWRREALSWMAREEPDRLAEQFSITERARLGGLDSGGMAPWGTASIVTGCLCLRMPPARIPEVILGRAADGIVGGQSADLMLRVADLLTELQMPASLAAPVLRYAMRGFLDAVTPQHAADVAAFARQARALDRRTVEDYLGALAAVGPLRPRPIQP